MKTNFNWNMLVGFNKAEESRFQRTWMRSGLRIPARFVTDQQEAIACLRGALVCEGLIPGVVFIKWNDAQSLELLRWIRQQSGYRDLVVVMCADDWQPEEIKQADAAGADTCLTLSNDVTEMMRLLRRLEHHWFSAKVA
jgi:CheY-like chemotaxis protein